MTCLKNIYELFNSVGPELTYDVDRIYYLGYSPTSSLPPSFTDVVPSVPYFHPKASVEGGPFQDLTSTTFGPVLTVNSVEAVVVSNNSTLILDIGQYCFADGSQGDPAQPGFYFFMREVVTGTCTTFSGVVCLEVKDGVHLPDDINVTGVCTTTAGVDCYDVTQHLDPAITGNCISPEYNNAYWNVPNPTCFDLSAGGTFTFQYIVPSTVIQSVKPIDPNCSNCEPDDLIVNINVFVGPDYEALTTVLCN